MFEWWRKRKERKRYQRELLERYPLTTDNPYKAVIWKASQKLAAHLKRYTVIARPEDTLRQYHYKASRFTGIDVEALYRHLYILEESMYSHHDMGAEHKDRAIIQLRDIEMSLEKISLPKDEKGLVFTDPDPVSNQPVVMPPKTGRNTLAKERFPEREDFRSTRPADLRRLVSRFDATGSDGFSEMEPGIVSSISELVWKQRFRELKKILMESSAAYMSTVHLSEMTGLYIIEMHYRIREVLALDEPDMDGLLGLVVPGAKVLAASERRDYLIPDDVKVSLLCFLPGYKMRSFEDAVNIIDAVQVPSPIISEVEPSIMLTR